MSNLLPCPFCGERVYISPEVEEHDRGRSCLRFRAAVRCEMCRAHGGFSSYCSDVDSAIDQAEMAWNLRRPPRMDQSWVNKT